MRAEKPRAVIFAGPNGSGKSTLTAQLRNTSGFDFPTNYINADDIARVDTAGTGEERERSAFRAARQLRQDYREAGISHAFETVFSHPSGLLDLIRLRDSGFDVTFVYVTTGDPRINVGRVAGRVLRGGHDVPVDRIIDRWDRSMRFLPRAVEIANRARIYDSSAEIELVAMAEDGQLFTRSPLPVYLVQRLEISIIERAKERQILQALIPLDAIITLPDETAGVYSGNIHTNLTYHCLQQIGPKTFVRHDKVLLTAPISDGEDITITYKDGYGTPQLNSPI